jgi:hypothetical protein
MAVEFMPLVPKVVVGVVFSGVALLGAAELWIAKRRERRSGNDN